MPVSPPPGANKVFEGQLATAYQWEQEMFDGTTRTFECYVRPDTVEVVPFLDRDTVLLTKQDQPARETFWDFPGGRVDPGETLDEAARREFMEETGYAAKTWELWRKKTHSGLIRYEQALYLAKGLEKHSDGNIEQDGERIELIPTKWKDVVKMCLRKELRQPDVMLAIVAMEYDAEERAKLEAFLNGL